MGKKIFAHIFLAIFVLLVIVFQILFGILLIDKLNIIDYLKNNYPNNDAEKLYL